MQIRPAAPRRLVAELERLLRDREWIATDRKYVADPGALQFSETMWPKSQIYQHVAEMIGPAFSFDAVQINRYDPVRWAECKRHRDSKNRGLSWMMILGDFEGGVFYLEENAPPAPPTAIRTTKSWIVFDGSFFHWASPVTRGTRFSVIAFNFADLA